MDEEKKSVVKPTVAKESLSKEDEKRKKRESIRAEKREYKELRKIKRGKKALRLRKTKNLLFFLAGFFSFIIFVGTVLFIGLKVIPVKTYLGDRSDEYVSQEKIGDKSIIDAFLGIKDITIADVPALYNVLTSAIESTGINEIIKIDKNKLGEIEFSSNFASGVLDSIKIAKELFGDFGELEIFQYDVETTPDTMDADFEPKLYCVKNAEGEYVNAFNEDGTRVAGTESLTVYFYPVSEMSLKDMQTLLLKRFQLSSVKSMLKTIAGMGDDAVIAKIIGDKNVKEMANFDAGEVKLNSIIDEPSEQNSYANKQLFDILKDAAQKSSYSDITIGDITSVGFDIQNIKLTTVMENSGNTAKIYDILVDITGKPVDELVIDDLKDFNVEEIKLTIVLPKTESNEKMYNILCEASGVASAEDLKISHLKNLDIDSVSLTTVLPEDPSNAKLSRMYSILKEATGKSSTSEIQISDMSAFDINKVKLSSVVELPTVDNGMKNERLYQIIWDASKYEDDGGNITYPTDTDYASLILGDIASAHFDVNMVRLSTVLSNDSENPIIKALFSDGSVRLGNLSEKMKNLRVDDLYEIECFTKNALYTRDLDSRYAKSTNMLGETVYTKTLEAVTEDNNVYYINGVDELAPGDGHQKSGIWLFVLYTAGGKDVTPGQGYAATYTDKNLTFEHLRGNVGSMSDDFMNATVRELYISGILGTKYDNIMHYTMNGVMEAFNTYISLIP